MCNNSTACDHIGLFSADAKALSRFYIEKLDFKKEKDEVLPASAAEPIFGIPSDCIFMRLEGRNGLKIEIFEPVSFRIRKARKDIVGYHHWGFCVGDRKKFSEELKGKGVKVDEVKRGANIVYFAEDLDGNKIEIRD